MISQQGLNYIIILILREMKKGKYSELLLSSVNHSGFLHFGMNMFVLYNMGSFLQHIIPPAEQFLSFYFSAS